MAKLGEIAEGWLNTAYSKLGVADKEVEELAKKRLAICDKCIIRTGPLCDPTKKTVHFTTGETVSGCGCPLISKSRSKNSKCPAGKW